MQTSPKTSFECPVCGAEVPKGAHACPECGADERSGWNEEETRLDGLDLPDTDDESKEKKPSAQLARVLWVGAGLTALAILIWMMVMSH
jgi:predicted nucleic acid-binding Zn ribbon protein